MQFLVPLGTVPVLADVGVFAPAAASKLYFLPDAPADGAHLQQVSNNVPGVASPSFKGFLFFPNPFEFVAAEHELSPTVPVSMYIQLS
jgi:hypothetical protein